MRLEVVWYVNQYTKNRNYGGPEEGGWHYENGIFNKCRGMFTEKQEAYKLANELTKECDKNNRERGAEGDLNSVLCCGIEDIMVEINPGKDWSEDSVYS